MYGVFVLSDYYRSNLGFKTSQSKQSIAYLYNQRYDIDKTYFS